jgi:hypothetical protein
VRANLETARTPRREYLEVGGRRYPKAAHGGVDYAAILSDFGGAEVVLADEALTEALYETLGLGSVERGKRKFAQLESERLDAEKRQVVADSVVTEQQAREMQAALTRQKLDLERARIDAELAALDSPPPASE